MSRGADRPLGFASVFCSLFLPGRLRQGRVPRCPRRGADAGTTGTSRKARRTRRSREARPTALVGDRPLLSLLPAVRLARLVAPVAAAAHLAAHLLHRPAELLELPLQFADLVARDARLARPLDVPRGGFGATTGPRLRVLAPTRLGLASRRRDPPAAGHAREARGARGAETPPTGAAFDPRQLLLR